MQRGRVQSWAGRVSALLTRRWRCPQLLLGFPGCTTLEQVGLNLKFLVGSEIHFGFEALISGQADHELVLAGADQHRLANAAEFAHMSYHHTVDKHSRSRRIDGE